MYILGLTVPSDASDTKIADDVIAAFEKPIKVGEGGSLMLYFDGYHIFFYYYYYFFFLDKLRVLIKHRMWNNLDLLFRPQSNPSPGYCGLAD